MKNLEPIYAGTVSKERPYRREVANAVLDYLQSVIENRRWDWKMYKEDYTSDDYVRIVDECSDQIKNKL